MPKVNKGKTTLAHHLKFERDLQLDDGTPIKIGFNNEKYEWMRRFLPVLEFGRGIREQGLQVDSDAALMMRQRAKQDGRKQITMQDLAAVRAQIGGVMNSAKDDTFAEFLVPIVLDFEDKIFELREVQSGIIVDVKPPFDVYEVPEWWFDSSDDDDPLMAMFARNGHIPANKPKRNPANPLDVMCGIAAGILEANPEFTNLFNNVVDRASLAAYFGGVEIDGESDYFLSLVDRILYDPLADNDDNDDGQDTETRD